MTQEDNSQANQALSDPQNVQALLDDFAAKTEQYAQFCQAYQNGSLNLADVTRHLGEAATDAEAFFAENSHMMDMEQLQRYGQLQSRLDALTVQLFETDISRNQEIVLAAMENGDYFIVNLTYNAIKSSIYMIYAKQRIKSQQDLRLAEMQQDLEIAQTFIKVLKALESVLTPEPAAQEPEKIEKALNIYCDYFQHADDIPLKAASDQRVFKLFSKQAESLQTAKPSGWQEHLLRCRGLLGRLAVKPEHQQLLASWDRFLSASTESWRSPEAALDHQTIALEAEATDMSPSEQDAELAQLLQSLAQLLQIEVVEQLNFSQLEGKLADFIMELLAQRGSAPPGQPGHQLFELFSDYIDFLSNVDYGGDYVAAGEHLSRCCSLLEGLAQTEQEQQMLETWNDIPFSLSVLVMQRGFIA